MSVNKIVWPNVVAPQNRQRTLATLHSLKAMGLSNKLPDRNAAVLVPLCIVNKELSLLFTLRSMHLRNNRGQVSFPGGMEDPEDGSLEVTALRETSEEVGISKEQIDVWGSCPKLSRDDMTVTPFLAFLGDVNPDTLPINTNEVQKAFGWSLSSLCDPANFQRTNFRTKSGIHYTLPAFKTNEYRVWGITALITHTVLSALVPQHYPNKIQRPSKPPTLPS